MISIVEQGEVDVDQILGLEGQTGGQSLVRKCFSISNFGLTRPGCHLSVYQHV